MIALHPNILKKNGRNEFVVLPFEEFKKIEEELQDYEDLKDLREAKALDSDSAALSLEDAKKELNIM